MTKSGLALLGLTGWLVLASGCSSDTAPGVADALDSPGADAAAGGEDSRGDGLSDTDTPQSGSDSTDAPMACDDSDCDDGLDCTEDRCDLTAGACVWTLKADTCLIGGACYTSEARSQAHPCRGCRPGTDAHSWTELEEGAACDNGDPCTGGGSCQGGECEPDTTSCDDDDPCTDDSCDPATGCVFVPLADAEPCDDGDLCTVGDACVAGSCEGALLVCDDMDPCTDEVCEPASGCVASLNQADCDDGAPCTDGDHCQEGACVPAAETNCDDGDVCTIDLCDDAAGCVHLPTQNACCTGEAAACNDGNPCTTASCDEATGDCVHIPNTTACDDGDACTIGDLCGDSACSGGAIDCDDGNPCTDDLCSPADGCLHVPQDGGPCDDGVECSSDDVCSDGVCVGDMSGCSCQPVFEDAAKAVFVEMGTAGFPGDGLDLDGDSSTCAPEGDCSDGVDNALAILAGLANDSIADAVASGDLNFILELRGTAPNDLVLAAYVAELDPDNAECDYQTSTCSWHIDKSMLDEETCTPESSLESTLDGNTLNGGGVGSELPFALPLGDSTLTVTLTNLRFVGDLTLVGGQIASFNGVFGGAVPKAVLEAAIDSVPDEDLPLPKAAIASFLGLLDNDIDTDGDGVKDALSMGLKVDGIDAVITGTY